MRIAEYRDELNQLAARARQGDGAALERLRGELDHCLGRVVARALHAPEDGSPLARAVRSAAGLGAADKACRAPAVTEVVVERVSRQLSREVLDRVRGTNLGGMAAAETVQD